VLARLPEIRVRPASQVMFHLGFDPAALRLTMAPGVGIPPLEGPGRTFPLTVGRDVAWTATGAGGVATLIPETEAGDVWYRARLAITTDTAEPSISALRPVRRGADVALSFRASERVSVAACIAPATGQAARFRAVHASGLGPGRAVMRLGRLPVDRYLVTLVVRDAGGNGGRARIRFGPAPTLRAR